MRILSKILILLTFTFLVACSSDDTPIPVVADFDVSDSIIVQGDTLLFKNNSVAASQYLWDFGDGQSSIEENPSHVYDEPGFYTITLKAIDNDNSDQFSRQIEVLKIPNEIGSWELDGYLFMNVPSDYAKHNEGRVFAKNEISFGGNIISSYNLNLMEAGDYQRKIEFEHGVPKLESSGTWDLNGDEFILNDSETGIETFNVQKNINDDLWLSQETGFLLIKDAILDTITQDYINTLSDAEFEALFDFVQLDFVYAFEKE